MVTKRFDKHGRPLGRSEFITDDGVKKVTFGYDQPPPADAGKYAADADADAKPERRKPPKRSKGKAAASTIALLLALLVPGGADGITIRFSTDQGSTSTTYQINSDAVAATDQDPYIELLGGDGSTLKRSRFLQESTSTQMFLYSMTTTSTSVTSDLTVGQPGSFSATGINADAILTLRGHQATDAVGTATTASFTLDASADTCVVAGPASGFHFTGVADGTASVTLTAGDLVVTDGDLRVVAGDFNVSTDAADSINIGKAGTGTVDMIVVNGGTVATSGADLSTWTYVVDGTGTVNATLIRALPTFTDDDADGTAGHTWNVFSIDPQTATLSADGGGSLTATLNGYLADTLTETVGGDEVITSTAFRAGTGWDTVLGGTSAGTNILGFTNATITTAGAASFASNITSTAGNITATAGDLVVTDGDVNFTTGAAETMNLGKSAAPTTDVFAVAAGTSATNGVDAMTIGFTIDGPGAISGDLLQLNPVFTDDDADGTAGQTWNVISVPAFTATLSADAGGTLSSTVNGLAFGDLTETVGGDETIASTAVRVGTGWDAALGGTTTGTNILAFTNATITSAGAATFQTNITSTAGNITATAGNITVTDGNLVVSAGDVNFTTDAGDTINVAKGAAPTADVFAINGGTSATTGVDALTIAFVVDGAGAISGDLVKLSPTFTDDDADGTAGQTWNVIEIDAQTVTLSADGGGALTSTVNGLKIGTVTESTGGDETITSSAVNVGTGWDTVIKGTTAGTDLISFTNFSVATSGAITTASTVDGQDISALVAEDTDGEIEIPVVGSGFAESGTWTASMQAGGPRLRHTASAGAEVYWYAIPVPTRTTASMGIKPLAIVANYEVTTADLDNVTIQLYRVTMGADGAARTMAVDFGDADAHYDAAHDTAAERGDDTAAPELHRITVTDPAATYVGLDVQLWLKVTVDGDAGPTGVFDLTAAKMTYAQTLLDD